MTSDIIIPIYKELPSADDLISLEQIFKVLRNFDITFIHPVGLDLKNYRRFAPADFRAFNADFFKDIQGYNRLMLDKNFYQEFQKKFLLIYQTDAFVFKDELNRWMSYDYDYIGAPWLRTLQKPSPFKKIWDSSTASLKSFTNYKKNRNIQKNKSLIYNEVGNGGFSLRKREKFIEILDRLSEEVKIYLKPENSERFFAEDVFYSIEPQRSGIRLHKPDFMEACGFAIENKPAKALKYTSGQLPFGCHHWNLERDFWRPYFADEGYKI